MRRTAPISCGLLGAILVLGFLAHRVVTGTAEAAPFGGVGATLLLLYLWLDREAAQVAARNPTFRNTSRFAGVLGLAAAVVVALNAVAIRHDREFDLSLSRTHTLKPQTVQILASLSAPVEIVGFFTAGSTEQAAFSALTQRLARRTTQLEIRTLDPVRNPGSYRKYEKYMDPAALGSDRIILLQEERSEILSGRASEKTLIDGLVRLTSGVEHVICFTVGHGERGVDADETLGGYGAVIQRLEGQNYRVQNRTLLREGLAGCEIVVVAGPRVGFLSQERDMLWSHIAAGGGALLLLDPVNPDAVDPLATELARYGFAVGRDLVLEVDPTRQLAGVDGTWVVLGSDSFGVHPIAEGLRHSVILQGARSVDLLDTEGRTLAILAATTAQAWAETDPASLLGEVTAEPDPETDRMGPIPLGAASEPSAGSGGGRLVVFGDADFPSNQFVLQGVGDDLFLNALAWLAEEESQLAERAQGREPPSLQATRAQMRIVWLISVVAAPGLALLAGIGSWIRRRGR
jgi:hypothetical protein